MAETTDQKHILTSDEAINALRISPTDECPNLELLLSAVDDGIQAETGHDWTQDDSIDPTAKLAASLFLISLFSGAVLPAVYIQTIVKLDAKAKEAADSG